MKLLRQREQNNISVKFHSFCKKNTGAAKREMQLAKFVHTERRCCDFFKIEGLFELSFWSSLFATSAILAVNMFFFFSMVSVSMQMTIAAVNISTQPKEVESISNCLAVITKENST